jgi:hypothetical protein
MLHGKAQVLNQRRGAEGKRLSRARPILRAVGNGNGNGNGAHPRADGLDEPIELKNGKVGF